MELAFADPATEVEHEIKVLIEEFAPDQETKFQQELFKQKKRLADAKRVLQAKPTKEAEEDQRIASSEVERALDKLFDLYRTELDDSDSRIFPHHFAPVLVVESGQRVVKAMRCGFRLADRPAFYDIKFPGTYNTRVDFLAKFWKPPFRYSHGIIVVDAFYENVNTHRAERRELRDGEEKRMCLFQEKFQGGISASRDRSCMRGE